MLLSDRVHRNAPFANYDDRMVSSAVRAHPPASGAAAAQQATGARNPAAPPAVNSAWMDGVCRDYNRSSCHRGAGCSYLHECSWHGCSGADRKHAAFDCPSRPAGFKPQPGQRGVIPRRPRRCLRASHAEAVEAAMRGPRWPPPLCDGAGAAWEHTAPHPSHPSPHHSSVRFTLSTRSLTCARVSGRLRWHWRLTTL